MSGNLIWREALKELEGTSENHSMKKDKFLEQARQALKKTCSTKGMLMVNVKRSF